MSKAAKVTELTPEAVLQFVKAFVEGNQLDARLIYSQAEGAIGAARQQFEAAVCNKDKIMQSKCAAQLNKASHDYAMLHYIALVIIEELGTATPGWDLRKLWHHYADDVINCSFFSALISNKGWIYFETDRKFAWSFIKDNMEMLLQSVYAKTGAQGFEPFPVITEEDDEHITPVDLCNSDSSPVVPIGEQPEHNDDAV